MANPNPSTKHLERYKWQPGQSGNPERKNLQHKTPIQYAKEELQAIDPKTGKPKAQVIGIGLVDDAIKGKGEARKTILEYTDGKPAQVYQIENRELRITGSLEDLTKLRELALNKQNDDVDNPLNTPQNDIIEYNQEDTG